MFVPRIFSRLQRSKKYFHHSAASTCAVTEPTSAIPVADFEKEFTQNRIPINFIQKSVLAVGSATMAITDPSRGDMIACMGEVTGEWAGQYILNKMEQSEEGLRILKDRPRITSQYVDLEKLKNYPEGTLGKAYSTFLIVNDVTPDSRDPVRFIENIHLAYAIQRYRDVHDLTHTLLYMPTNMLGEVTVKWVEAIQTRLPMCIGGALFGAVRLKTKQRQLYQQHYLPWALDVGNNSKFLMNLYFEKRWDQQISDIYQEMDIKPFTGPKTKKIGAPKINPT